MLEDCTYQVNLQCVFCKSKIFQLPYEGYQPESGDMIRCANCGNSNDYTFRRRTLINKTVEQIENNVVSEIAKMFKKAGFKTK